MQSGRKQSRPWALQVLSLSGNPKPGKHEPEAARNQKRMDKEEYEETVRDVADALYRFAYRLCKDQDEAKDLVQESFVRLWVNRGKVGIPKAFLFRTAYRQFLDSRKHEKVRQDYAGFAFYKSKERERTQPLFPERGELKEMLDRALDTLPPVQKAVVLLRDYEGYSYEEIGEISGLSEAQVKTYIFRARVALRKYIGELGKALG